MNRNRSRIPRLWVIQWARFKKNKLGVFGLFWTTTIILLAILAPVISIYGPEDLIFTTRQSPSWEHIFGIDIVGRDVFSRVLYGCQTAVIVGFGSTIIAATIGILFGGIAGYFGGKIDDVLMRLTDVILILPLFVFLVIFAKIFRTSIINTPLENVRGISLTVITLIIALFNWCGTARITRGEALKLKGFDFIEAARSIGASEKRIFFEHLLPNLISVVIVYITLVIGSAIVMEAGLSYLGFGDPSMISWGSMISQARASMPIRWWETIFPGIAIFLTVLGFSSLGEGLSDVFR